jgi:glycerol uptake facilitator-like aquaporin
MNYNSIVAEFLGSIIFILSILLTNGNPLIVAITLGVLIYSAASYSGANLNPAVSIVMGLKGVLSWTQVPIYIAAQVAGGVVAWVINKYAL